MLDACALNLLAVDGSAVDRLVAAKPYFTKGQIPGAQYGLSADVPSFGVTAILMTAASMDSRVVAEFAKSLTSQIDALKKRHPGARKPEQSSDPAGQTSSSPSSRRGPGQWGAWGGEIAAWRATS